jgi:hypothetical protein
MFYSFYPRQPYTRQLPIARHNRQARIALPTGAVLLAVCCGLAGLYLSGCGRKPPGGSTTTGPLSAGMANPTIGLSAAGMANEEQLNGETSADEGGWLTGENLAEQLPGLLAKARGTGMAAAWIEPDPAQPDSFLVVAPDDQSAKAINGYFYWLASQTADGNAKPLLLGIDRLFSDDGRDAAIKSGDYSEPDLVELLDCSLQQVLQGRYKPDMLTFILSCYRKDFASRLQNTAGFTDQTWSGQFQGMEVSYNASIISSVTFRIIPG